MIESVVSLIASTRKLLATMLMASLLGGLPTAYAADEYSVAEQKVFLDNHLKNIPKLTTLEYDFKQTGKPDQTIDDKVKVMIGAGSTDKRTISVDFLSGVNKVELPSQEGGTGNPVILYFLEKDIRDMHNLLGGQQAYFRKRIRLALAESAAVRPVKLTFSGKTIDGSEVTIAPYSNDPLKDRLGEYTSKTYVFTLSDGVPGGVYELRTDVGVSGSTKTVPAVKSSLKLIAAKG